jgi:acyl-coenzyme A thioesterase PaaI-like protein
VKRVQVDLSGSGRTVRAVWDRLRALPGGKRVFDALLGVLNPYTGSVAPRFEEIRPGYARVAMAETRAVRNHVGSVHAIALANLGEMSTGLGLMAGLPADARAILTRLQIDYLKKARGTLVAEGRCEVPPTSERREVDAEGTIRNADGDVVAVVQARWLVGPKRDPASGRPGRTGVT